MKEEENRIKYINDCDIEYLIERLGAEFMSELDEQAYIDGLILKLQVLLLDRYKEYGLYKKKQEMIEKEIVEKLRAYEICEE